MTATYRELILSVGARFLDAQWNMGEPRKTIAFLPSFCCEACGAPPERSIGVTTAWFLFQIAAYLLDKVEDGELEQVSSLEMSVGVAANLTTGMILIAQWILNHLELDRVDPGAAWDIQRAFQETLLSACSGQHLDLSIPLPDLETCWQIAEAKSGATFSLACYAGARLATNQTAILNGLEKFGRHLGTIIQISDDLEDIQAMNQTDSNQRIDKTIVGAYLNFVEKKNSNHSGNPVCERDQELTRQKAIHDGSALYLQLEAWKYAGMAENELNSLSLPANSLSKLRTIIQQESRLGAMTN
jgi:geranylgeranyl pyrophosphate synthase